MTPPRRVPIPLGGALRVHPAPEALPRLRDKGPPSGRFDDPAGRFAVRYVAAGLAGCLTETMARFRPDPEADALLAAVADNEGAGNEPDLDTRRAVGEWLAAQQVGRIIPSAADTSMVDVESPELLVELDRHPAVRRAIDTSPLATIDAPVHLDAALIRLAGRVGRPITQTVARAIYDAHPDVDGLAYYSRIDPGQRCWAIFGHVPVDVATTALSADDPEHRDAVTRVADLLHIPLPDRWRRDTP